jgi:hypothetical protein
VDRGPEIASLGEAARAAFEDKHHAREITIAASQSNPGVCGIDTRDAPW